MGSIPSTTGTFHYGNRKKTGVCLPGLEFWRTLRAITKNPPPVTFCYFFLLPSVEFIYSGTQVLNLKYNFAELVLSFHLYMASRLSGLHGKHLICWTILIVLRGFCPRTPINPWTIYVQEHEKWDATLFKRSLWVWHTRHCLFLPSADLQQHSKTM